MPLRLPLKPHVPPLAQQSVSPRWSVIVTVVLLKVASMKAIPDETLSFLFLQSWPLFSRPDSPDQAYHFLPVKFCCSDSTRCHDSVFCSTTSSKRCKLLQILYALLASNRFLRTFTSSCICSCALTTNWQATSMTKPTITTNVFQSRNTLCNLSS